MADKNQITLVGKIGSPIKKGKTTNGDAYWAFLLEVESRDTSNSSANNYHQYISVRIFRAPVIKYLERLNVHRGTNLVVFGFISSYTDEIRGKKVVANSVNGVEVYVIQVKPYNTNETK